MLGWIRLDWVGLGWFDQWNILRVIDEVFCPFAPLLTAAILDAGVGRLDTPPALRLTLDEDNALELPTVCLEPEEDDPKLIELARIIVPWSRRALL